MRVRPDVDTTARLEICRPHVIEENKWAYSLSLRRRQGPAYDKLTEILGRGIDHQFDQSIPVRAVGCICFPDAHVTRTVSNKTDDDSVCRMLIIDTPDRYNRTLPAAGGPIQSRSFSQVKYPVVPGGLRLIA